ncbi:MAG: hydrogenase maturation nickel metallochaperone HypA [Helicobacteraceae bacterium]|jgi:hydrogenase nickel incorporation protein HypA/HybF|nr:hydrogenase maturation nickel metallochaperone HypA [Helicobacteraceae bacterium]
MHEYSIVQALLESCEREARKADAKKVTLIKVKVGRLSNIEPALLSSAFEFFSQDSFCNGAKLEIVKQNVVIECANCGAKTELAELDFCCPNCASEDIKLIDGEDILLMSLVIE